MSKLILDGRFLWGAIAVAMLASPLARAEKDPMHPGAQDEITGTVKSDDARSDDRGKSGDNSGKNEGGSVTAQQQGGSRSDIELTAQLRRAIVADKRLSSAAHNVKIITRSGVVTLKGPVKSVDERRTIDVKAKELAGDMNVKNELDVAP